VKPMNCDIAILGAGFGGTLLSLIAQKLGYSVVLLERGTHPRFAIGESSTPLGNFKLAAITDRFGLGWLKPFAKYGAWKAVYPNVTCGLKRGFSFFKHESGRSFQHTTDNANALVVAASPRDEIADVHWFRAEFDANLVLKAVDNGVQYLDQFETRAIRHAGNGWEITGVRGEGPSLMLRASLIVDATGNGQAIGEALSLKAVLQEKLFARSRGLYSHFTGVGLWHDVLEEDHGPASTRDHTFPCDSAALHHIIDGGWMWVLRFENGVTSAGFSLDPDRHPIDPRESPEAEWKRLLNRYPSLARQFSRAEPVRPFTRTGRLQRRFTQAAGPDWAMLPHAVGFLDAWLSPGIAQTLYAVNRLGMILADRKADRPRRLEAYGQAVIRELEWVDEITGTCFACFDRFPVMATASMLYFTAAINGEERERTGQAAPDDAFLMADHPEYRAIAQKLFRQALVTPIEEAGAFMAEARRLLEPYNLCNLCDVGRRNMYPCVESLHST
jgi:FADH2 O2-dependent halogenase